MRMIKVGDYVEVLGGDSGDVVTGEQGLVIDESNQGSLRIMFPARNDLWATEFGWRVQASLVKLLYRPSQSTKI